MFYIERARRGLTWVEQIDAETYEEAKYIASFNMQVGDIIAEAWEGAIISDPNEGQYLNTSQCTRWCVAKDDGLKYFPVGLGNQVLCMFDLVYFSDDFSDDDPADYIYDWLVENNITPNHSCEWEDLLRRKGFEDWNAWSPEAARAARATPHEN